MSTKSYLTTLEIASILHCTKAHVADLVKRGHFPNAIKMDPTRSNSPLRIPRTDVEAFAKSQNVGSITQTLVQALDQLYPAG